MAANTEVIDNVQISTNNELEYKGLPISSYDLTNWVVDIFKEDNDSELITCRIIEKAKLKSKNIIYIGLIVDTGERIILKPHQIYQVISEYNVDMSSIKNQINDKIFNSGKIETGEPVSDEIEMFEIFNEDDFKELTVNTYENNDDHFPEKVNNSQPGIGDFFHLVSINKFDEPSSLTFNETDMDDYSKTMLQDKLIKKTGDVLDNVEKRIITKIKKEGPEIFQRNGFITGAKPSEVAIATLESTISFIKMDYKRTNQITEKSVQNLITFAIEYLLTLESNDEQ